jgi:glycosyltransferase involved in cell wall biosynthesis
METPLLHVVIPAYGDSPYLAEAIESVVNSLDLDTPITVLDDASESPKVLETTQRFFPKS